MSTLSRIIRGITHTYITSIVYSGGLHLGVRVLLWCIRFLGPEQGFSGWCEKKEQLPAKMHAVVQFELSRCRSLSEFK